MSPAAPGEVLSDGSLLLRHVALADGGGPVDLLVGDGRVASIERGSGAPRWVCLPPLADLHVHANRAFTPAPARPRGLDDAARNVAATLARFGVADHRRHAALLFGAARSHATTRVRTHADVDAGTGLAAVAGTLQAAEEFAPGMQIETVAFAAADSDPVSADGRRRLREAVALGAGLLGAAPAFCDQPQATIDAVLDLAGELGVAVDLHLDEHLQPAACLSGYLARAVARRGLEGRVTLSHGCAIAALDDAARKRTLDELAAARITVIALPRTNLYLQDATGSLPRHRGIANVREMIRHGVAVRFASDNIRDAFYPFGDADLIGVAMDAILATQLDDGGEVVAAICAGRRRPAVDEPADFVLIRADSLDAVFAEAPAERWIARRGVLQLAR